MKALGWLFLSALCIWWFFSGMPTSIGEILYPTIDVPQSSETFNCKHSTLYMYKYFTGQGHEAYPFAGNLDTIGETLQETNHIWLLVNYDGEDNNQWVAYDWGEPCLDDQHYEGYWISYEELCQAVEYDRKKGKK